MSNYNSNVGVSVCISVFVWVYFSVYTVESVPI